MAAWLYETRRFAYHCPPGASAHAPENTMAAFRLVWRLRADGVQRDVRLTSDEKVVCIYEATTGRASENREGPIVEQLERSLDESAADGLGVGCHSRHDFDMYERLKGKGLFLNAWTVDTVDMARQLWLRGFDSITTDQPDVLLAGFGR
ncbi:MAG: glycerophosphodiester phosphodiesterase [Verrucomicrobiota bacterium]